MRLWRNRHLRQLWIHWFAACKMQCSVVIVRGLPNTSIPVHKGEAWLNPISSRRLNSGENHIVLAPYRASASIVEVLKTGTQGLISLIAPLWWASKSSDIFPTAQDLSHWTNESLRTWSRSRQTSSNKGMGTWCAGHAWWWCFAYKSVSTVA